MKKLIAFVVLLVCILVLVGCSSSVSVEKGSHLLKEGKVKSVSVESLPKYYDYIFHGNDAKAIVEYFENLNLVSDFEDSTDGDGTTWVVSLEYENGEVVTIYHCDVFIKNKGGSWYKTTYEEARRFDTLLNELNN